MLATFIKINTRKAVTLEEAKVNQGELVFLDRKAAVGDFVGNGDVQLAVFYSKDPFFQIETDAGEFIAVYTKSGEEIARTSEETWLGFFPLEMEAVTLDKSGKSYMKTIRVFGPHHLESTFFGVDGSRVFQIPCKLRTKSEVSSNCSFANTSVNLDEVIVEDLDNDGNYEAVHTIDGFLPDCEGYPCRYAAVVAIYTFDDGIFIEIGDEAVFDKLFQSLVNSYTDSNLRKSISNWEN